jgi:prepilin-type N-terminal cleavage/methylation domain-containing protein
MANRPSSVLSCRGFTLIELSIVLAVIGLLVGLGAGMIGPLTAFVKVRETRDLQDAALQAVTSWASSHNRLPAGAEFPGVASSPADAWGRNLVYLYDADLYAAAPTKDTICGRRSTALTLVNTDPAASTANVALVILSGAEKAFLTATLNVALNGAPSNGAITGTGSASGTVTLSSPGGDLARWVTLDELRSKVGCQGAPLKIANNELPFGAAPNAYSVTLTADGGVPFAVNPSSYKWCVGTLPAGFVQTGGIQNADCSSLSEASWGAASAGLALSFPPGAVVSGAYPITVVARDNAAGVLTSSACNSADAGDNCAQKLFVLTVNPQ